jgi:integrase
MWDNVDFEANVIRIRRIQMRDGSLSEFTKTAAGVREVPMSPMLRELLLAWRDRCPRTDGALIACSPRSAICAHGLCRAPTAATR